MCNEQFPPWKKGYIFTDQIGRCTKVAVTKSGAPYDGRVFWWALFVHNCTVVKAIRLSPIMQLIFIAGKC